MIVAFNTIHIISGMFMMVMAAFINTKDNMSTLLFKAVPGILGALTLFGALLNMKMV